LDEIILAKIAFLITQSLETSSGLGRFGPLAKEFVRFGHQVEIFALHHDWNHLNEKIIIYDGVFVNYVSQMHIQKIGSQTKYYNPIKLIWVSILATIRMAVALWSSKAEIIQVCKAQPINLIAARLSRRRRPIFCDCDDYEAEINTFRRAWQYWIVKYFEDDIVNYVSGITTNTRYTLERYSILGYPENRILIIPNRIERSRFDIETDPEKLRRKLNINTSIPVVLYFGEMKLKSHPVDLLISAFKIVLKNEPDAKLLLVGGGQDLKSIKAFVTELNLFKNVIFTGRVNNSEIPDYISIANVTVEPVVDNEVTRSRYPLKLIESLYLGVPVVTSDIGDRRDILDNGKLGIFVNPNEEVSLAQGIISIIQDKPLQEDIKGLSKQKRDSFLWENMAENFLKIYEGYL